MINAFWVIIKPKVQVEPVNLAGVTIEFATGFNASFIYNNGIGPGSVIQITRAGDVIPHIIRVLTPMPTDGLTLEWLKVKY